MAQTRPSPSRYPQQRYARTAAQPAGGKLILVFLSILIAAISIYHVLGPPQHNSDWPLAVTTSSLCWLSVYLFASYAHFRTPYLLTNAYIIPLCVFHLGITIPLTFGWIEYADWTHGSLSKWLERAGWYTVLSLSCIGIGFGLAIKKSLLRRARATNPHRAIKGLRNTYMDGIGLLLASLVFLSFAIASVGNLLSYSRTDLFHGVGDTRGLAVFFMTFPSAAILLVIGARRRKHMIFAACVSGFAFLLLLLSGYRSAVLFPALVGTILWTKTGRKIPTLVAASALFFVVLAIPAVSMLRSMGPYDQIGQAAISTAIESTEVADTFTELGSTAGVLAHILRLVPGHDPHRWGTSYIQQLRESIPNISGEISESERAMAKQKASLDSNAFNQLTPSDWITYRIAPYRYNVGEGVGFSAIGEPYLNFGLAGVILFFTLLGALLCRLDCTNLLNHPRLLIFACAMLWPLTKTVRNDFGSFLKPAIFILIVIVIWRLILQFFPFLKLIAR